MRVVCAGAGQKTYMRLCEELHCSKLFSAYIEKSYIKKWPYEDRFLMVDSGAHSWNKFTITKIGHVSAGALPDPRTYILDYEKYIASLKHKKYIFVEFDVYGHLPKAEIDLSYYRVKALGGNIEFIRVYHPMIDGGSLEVLKEWIAEGQTYIGIGNDSIPLLGDIFRLTRDKVRIHGFAMTKMPLLVQFPFYSVDSTSPLATVMYGSFNDGLLKRTAKDKLLRDKSHKLFLSQDEKLKRAVQSVKDAEKYLTQLWEKKGIVWRDRYE